MGLRAVFLSFLLFAPICAFSGISGKYKMHGRNASGQEYTGTATITKVGKSVYQASWTFDDNTVDVGTGILVGSHLSFVFYESDPDVYGVVDYKIKGKKLCGGTVILNGTKYGVEKLVKIEKK